jgi:hypothetical protein
MESEKAGACGVRGGLGRAPAYMPVAEWLSTTPCRALGLSNVECLKLVTCRTLPSETFIVAWLNRRRKLRSCRLID